MITCSLIFFFFFFFFCPGHFNKAVIGSNTSERKTSNILLPSYSELELGKVKHSTSRILNSSYKVPEGVEQDYENIRTTHPPVRQTSLGTDRKMTARPILQQNLPLPQGGEQVHTVISISPDSEESGSPREGNPTTTTTTATAAGKTSANGRQQLSTLAPIQDEVPWYQSTQSMRSQEYPSPTSPLTPTFTENGEPPYSRPPSAPSASHNSLQHSLSNPTGPRPVPRAHSSMSQTSSLHSYSMERSVGRGGEGISRSAYSMGRNAGRSSKYFSHNKVHSIPANMHHFTDV